MKRLFFFSVILTIVSCQLSNVRAQDSVFSYTHQGTTLYYTIDPTGDAILVPPLYPNIDTVNDEMWTGYTKPQGAVVIPDSVPYGGSNHAVTKVGYCAFFKCNNVTSVTMPSTLRTIDQHGFLYCTSLISPAVPEGVTTIGFGAFDKCTSMLTITLPSTLTTIGEYAFYKCHSLQSVTLPESLTTIGATAFSLSGLTEIVLPEGLTSLGEFAFAECYNLQRVQFPSTLSAIGGASFQNDTSLISVTIPEGVDTIHQWAFYGCKALPSVTLPEGLVAINQLAFCGCSNLQSVNLPSTLRYLGKDCFSYNPALSSPIVIPSGVDTVAESAFRNCESLQSVTVSEGVKAIGPIAFAICPSLTSVSLPSSLRSIEKYAFWSDSSLSSIAIPDSLRFIGYASFYHCERLPNVGLPASLDSIADYAFEGCYAFDSIVFPDHLQYLGEGVIFRCPNITYCHLPEQLRVANKYLLSETGIERLVIPGNVTRMCKGVFFDCHQLRKVTLPAAVTKLDDSVFVRTPLLDTLVLENSVPPTMGNGIFTAYTATLLVPCGSAEAYRQQPVWGRFSNIEEDCTGIEEMEPMDYRLWVMDGRIFVEGADGETVSLYDLTGRLTQTFKQSSTQAIPAGVYLAKVGDRPAKKVVVIR